MRLGFPSSMAILLAGTGLALAQSRTPASSLRPVPASPASQQVMTAAAEYVEPTVAGTFATTSCSACGCGAAPSCGDAFDCCATKPYHVWASGDYLLWRIGTTYVPDIIANAPAGVAAFTTTTTITDSFAETTTTQDHVVPVLIDVNTEAPGGNRINFRDQPGYRINFGAWFDDRMWVGFDANFWWIWERAVGFNNFAQSNADFFPTGYQNQTYVLPIGSDTAELVDSTPVFIVAAGTTYLNGVVTNQMWGYEANLRCHVSTFGPARIDVITGYRFMDINETLQMSEFISLTPAGDIPDVDVFQEAIDFVAQYNDFVQTRNRFYGAQVGLVFDWEVGYGVVVNLRSKVALGDMRQSTTLRGNLTQTAPTSEVLPGGLLVGAADNNNRYVTDRICVIPEVNLKVGYAFFDWFRAYVGYDLMYVSSVARPADQLVRSNSTTIVTVGENTQEITTSQPTFRATSTDTTIQGINVSAEFRY